MISSNLHVICVYLKKDFLFWCSFSAFNKKFPQCHALIRVKWFLLILPRSLFTPETSPRDLYNSSLVHANSFEKLLQDFCPFCILFICLHFFYQLRGYCTPGQFLDCFCFFLKNYNTLVTSKIYFL